MGAEKMLLPAKEALRLPWEPQYNQAKLLVALNRVYRTILFIYLRERERVRGRLEGEREAHSPPSRDPRTPDSGPELKKD
ncbi:Condensin complex subunit 3 [Vulpes lagopus]